MSESARSGSTLSTPVGTALYMGAVLGAGVLVMPGIADHIAGPASLAAWALDAGLGAILAFLFAALGKMFPGEAGVLGFASAGLGQVAGEIAGWAFFIAAATGQVIVPLSGALYMGAALHLGMGAVLIMAETILWTAVFLNLHGLRLSGSVQLWLLGTVTVVLTGTAVLGLAHAQASRLEPFWSHGVTGAAHAATMLFFAFAGWEAIASLSGSFRDGWRGIRRATAAAVALVTALDLGVSAAVVLGLPRQLAASPEALLQIWRPTLGPAGTVAASAVALLLATGTTNAFVAGASRLGDRLTRPNRPAAPVPRATIWAIGIYSGLGIGVLMLTHLDLSLPLAISSGLMIVTYLICAVSGIRVLRGWSRAAAVAVALIMLVLLPQAQGVRWLIPMVLLASGALLLRRVRMPQEIPAKGD